MATFLALTIVGLTTASIYAVIASGLVLTYTTTGVFNFSHGAIGMLAAFAYWQLHIAWRWPTAPAVLVVLGILAPLIGVGIERLMRGVHDTSETARLVVSVSLLFGMIGLAQAVWDPGVGRTVPEFFTGSTLRLGSTSLSYHQLITIAVAVVAVVGLRVLVRRTRLGVSMRAVVDDLRLGRLNGVDPRRVQRVSWSLSTMLAAAGGILISSTAGLNAIVLSTLIVNAYAAAMFGRLRSIPMTVVGACVAGLTEGYLLGYLPKGNQYLPGLRLATPVIVLFAVLMVLPNRRLRGVTSTREYFPAPTRRGGARFCGFVLSAALVVATTLSDADLLVYGKLFPTALICLSFVPLMGYANQVSLCQLSLAGLGAITYGHLGTDGNPLALLAAALVAALAGALVALPALRLSGIHLALATAAFAVALDRWVFALPDFDVGPVGISIFGTGSVAVEPLRLFRRTLGSPRSIMILTAVLFVAIAAGVMWLRRSRFGRRLIALRDSEAACATFGMNLLVARVGVFALSAAIAGIGGAVSAMQIGSARAQDFEFVRGLPLFMLVAVGGAGFVSASLTAAVFLQGLLPLAGVAAPWSVKWQALASGGAGIGLGAEPNGAAAQFRDAFRHLAADTAALRCVVGGFAVVWALRLAGVYRNWPFVLLGAGVAIAGFSAAEVRARARGQAPSWVRTDRACSPAAGAPAPGSEHLAERIAAVDRSLGLAEFAPELA